MATANFNHKNALAALQVLREFDFAAFEALLNNTTVALAFDGDAVSSPEGWTTLELSANLLARLYPRVALVPLDDLARGACPKLSSLMVAINSELELSDGIACTKASIIVGGTPVPDAQSPIYIGSDGWIVRLSPAAPVSSGLSHLPFAASAAACFGAANMFRIVFGAQLERGELDGDFYFSMLDFQVNASEPLNPAVPAVDLGPMHLVGLGAIGNGLIWSLARVPELRGDLHLIDHERIELSNLQRYVLAGQRDRDAVKVELARHALQRDSLTVTAHAVRWAEYLAKNGTEQLSTVVVAVDSGEDRIAVQASLPKLIINAWTQQDDLGVSRHAFLGEYACLACLYLPEGSGPSEDEIVARAIRLPEEVRTVRELLHSGQPIGPHLLSKLAEKWAVAPEELKQFEAAPIRSFYAKAICGGLLLALNQEAERSQVPVPMAFQSALAGIMLGAELVRRAVGLPIDKSATTTRINLLRPIGQFLNRPERKHKSGRCLCQDPDYVAAYRAKHQV